MFKWLFCESDYVWKELGLCKAVMLNESLRFWMGYNFGRIATGSAADVEVSNSNQPREVSGIQTFFLHKSVTDTSIYLLAVESVLSSK